MKQPQQVGCKHKRKVLTYWHNESRTLINQSKCVMPTVGEVDFFGSRANNNRFI